MFFVTLKHWENMSTSTVATDGLVLKHQAISIYSADVHCIGSVSYKGITFIVNISIAQLKKLKK